jgi:uncharacterized OsmC-like protein
MSERDAAITDGIRRRERAAPSTVHGLDRVEITIVEGLTYAARNPAEPESAMRIGEPVERGGDGTGSSPLSHFLTGVGACLLNQFVRLCVADGIGLRFAGASVRGEFGREVGGAFRRIACEVHASGPIEPGDAAALVERAERFCYVHQTLRRSVEMTTTLVVDGVAVARHRDGPSDPTSDG